MGIRSGRSEAAFEIADRARSHSLIEHLTEVRGSRKGQGIPDELVESEAVLRRMDALLDALARSVPAGGASSRHADVAQDLNLVRIPADAIGLVGVMTLWLGMMRVAGAFSKAARDCRPIIASNSPSSSNRRSCAAKPTASPKPNWRAFSPQ